MASDLKVLSSHHIVRFWRSSENLWFQTILSIFWNISSWSSIILFHQSKFVMNGKAMTSLSQAINEQPSVALIFGLPLIGSWLIYHACALWVNKTEIIIEKGRIVFKQGPLPWSESVICLELCELENIWVEGYSPGYQDGRPLERYRLCVSIKSQGQKVLIQRLSIADKTVLEKWLEESKLVEELTHQDAA